jgi:hypothetical protein
VEQVITSPKLKAFKLRRQGSHSIVAPAEVSRQGLWRALNRLGFGHLLKSGLDEVASLASAAPRRGVRRVTSAPSPAMDKIS